MPQPAHEAPIVLFNPMNVDQVPPPTIRSWSFLWSTFSQLRDLLQTVVTKIRSFEQQNARTGARANEAFEEAMKAQEQAARLAEDVQAMKNQQRQTEEELRKAKEQLNDTSERLGNEEARRKAAEEARENLRASVQNLEADLKQVNKTAEAERQKSKEAEQKRIEQADEARRCVEKALQQAEAERRARQRIELQAQIEKLKAKLPGAYFRRNWARAWSGIYGVGGAFATVLLLPVPPAAAAAGVVGGTGAVTAGKRASEHGKDLQSLLADIKKLKEQLDAL